MQKQIKGCDVSRHNGADAVHKILAQDAEIKFIIAKATEGKTYKDPTFDTHMRAALNNNRLIGAYHYARPDNGNLPAAEALNFVNAVKPYLGYCLLALDWEDKALTQSNWHWALQWCEAVEEMIGVKPLVYVQESYVQELSDLADNDFGLWVAKWSDKEPTVKPAWPFWALWQHSNKPYDKDIFNGSEEQYKKYCEIARDENDDFCECSCHYCGCCEQGE